MGWRHSDDRADRPRTDGTRFGAARHGFARIWRKMSSQGGSDDFDAALAERYGSINRTVPDHGFEALVEQFARRVASSTAQSIREAKRLVSGPQLVDLELGDFLGKDFIVEIFRVDAADSDLHGDSLA
jgi:enoyl-CoA hydratase/carnithine racemase